MSDKEIQKRHNIGNSLQQSHTIKGQGDTPIVFYTKDKRFTYIYKKTEKLVSAVYLLTSFFNEQEPLRNELRSSSIGLLESQLKLIQEVGTSSMEAHADIKKNVLHIVSLLQAGFYAGLISEMNYEVLRKEFMALLSKLAEDNQTDESLFKNSFFDVPVETQTKIEMVKADVIEPKKDIVFYKGQEQKTLSNKKDERRNTILSIIQKKGKVSIKDIVEEIRGCSEKTIQRELSALVDDGTLRKVGERRWSRYMLV